MCGEHGGLPGPWLPVMRGVSRDEGLVVPSSHVSHSAVG